MGEHIHCFGDLMGGGKFPQQSMLREYIPVFGLLFGTFTRNSTWCDDVDTDVVFQSELPRRAVHQPGHAGFSGAVGG